jgi:hypothetical protein
MITTIINQKKRKIMTMTITTKSGKTLTTILFVLALISCGDDNSVTIPKQEYQKLIGDTIKPIYPKPFKLHTNGLNGEGIVLGSDGHEYLVINYQNSSFNAEHYIDCVKCIERTKTQDSLNKK